MSKLAQRELRDVAKELSKALRKFKRFNGPHEGYAVILEELDELWEEVKRRPAKRRPNKMRKEAVQVAAMALRFCLEVCNGDDSGH